MADEKRVQAAFINYVDEDGGGNLAMRGDTVDLSTIPEKEQKRLEEAGAFEGQEEPGGTSAEAYWSDARAVAQRNRLEDIPENVTADPETGLDHAGPPDPDEDEENEAETDMDSFGSVESGAARAAAEEEGDKPAPKRGRSKAASAPASTQGSSETA